MGGAIANDARKKRLPVDAGALGGFYEAMLALMVVTLGVVLLTASFAFMSVDGSFSEDPDLSSEAGELMASLLSEQFNDGRMAERSDLARLAWNGLEWDSDLGVRVMITELGGGTEVLYRSGDPRDMKERASLGEPVNVRYSQGDVRPASLTVWVWR